MASLNSSDFGSGRRSWIEEQLFVGDETAGLEGLHELRLTVLLRNVVKQKGRMEVTRTLRVNYKTLTAALHSGKLTPMLCGALERLLMIWELAALEEVRGSVKELVERVDEQGRVARTGLGLSGPNPGRSSGEPTRRWSPWSHRRESRRSTAPPGSR